MQCHYILRNAYWYSPLGSQLCSWRTDEEISHPFWFTGQCTLTSSYHTQSVLDLMFVHVNVNVFKIKKCHNTIVAKIAMLEICSFVDHKLAVFTYFKCIFLPCTVQASVAIIRSWVTWHVHQSNKGLDAKMGPCILYVIWLSIKPGSGQQTNEVQRIKV